MLGANKRASIAESSNLRRLSVCACVVCVCVCVAGKGVRECSEARQDAPLDCSACGNRASKHHRHLPGPLRPPENSAKVRGILKC